MTTPQIKVIVLLHSSHIKGVFTSKARLADGMKALREEHDERRTKAQLRSGMDFHGPFPEADFRTEEWDVDDIRSQRYDGFNLTIGQIAHLRDKLQVDVEKLQPCRPFNTRAYTDGTLIIFIDKETSRSQQEMVLFMYQGVRIKDKSMGLSIYSDIPAEKLDMWITAEKAASPK